MYINNLQLMLLLKSSNGLRKPTIKFQLVQINPSTGTLYLIIYQQHELHLYSLSMKYYVSVPYFHILLLLPVKCQMILDLIKTKFD